MKTLSREFLTAFRALYVEHGLPHTLVLTLENTFSR